MNQYRPPRLNYDKFMRSEIERWGKGGFLDEIQQSFVPQRTVEIEDIVADSAGVAFAAILGERILRKTRLDRSIR